MEPIAPMTRSERRLIEANREIDQLNAENDDLEDEVFELRAHNAALCKISDADSELCKAIVGPYALVGGEEFKQAVTSRAKRLLEKAK